MELIWFILTSYGLTQILVYGSIFNSIRPTKDINKMWTILFHCSMCMGFWVGVFLFSINGFTELFSFDYNVTNALLCGWLSSGTSYVLSELFGDRGLNLNYGDKND
mgnify:CR=1 FL=1|tara:strand:+ start:121 stop:438 length:318 start_codon:yes stop_codon:yes gene_type:complete